MDIINTTDFTFAFIIGRIPFPKYSLTYIIKGTFDLLPGKECSIAQDQLFPTGDEFYPEDEEMTGGPRYASDFAYFKPKTDLLLVGKCYSSEGKKVSSTIVKFQVGPKTKSLNVYGNRYWVGGASTNTATNPELFSELELRYEHSYGGNNYKKNPVGKGINKVELKTGDKLVPLPNILNSGEYISSQSTKPEPAGFGPLGQMWTQRFSKTGNYKGNYLIERWPWFPEDFDWEYFNAAPEDMQLSGYLEGDEKIYFENLHPVHSKYHSQLPGLRVRCFINELDKKSPDIMHFKEVKMNIDTLWVDMVNEKLVLVWRGTSEVMTEDYEEIKQIFIISEKLEVHAESTEYYETLLKKKLSEPEEEEIFEPPPPKKKEVQDIEIDAEIAKAEKQMRDALVKAGIDPDNPPEPSEENKRKEAEMLTELGVEEEQNIVPLTRDIFIDRINKKESFEGEDLRKLDLSELNIQGINLRNAVLAGVSLKNSNLSDADLTEANLSEADLSNVKLYNAIMKDTDLTSSILIKADLTGAIIEDAVFEKANLNYAILNEVKGRNAIFSKADLTEANILRGDLSGSDFSKSKIDKANLQGSTLREVSMEGVSGVEANLSETDLDGLKASEVSNFTRASFKKAKGKESIWEKANLTESDFSYSEMEGANFSSATLEKANLYASNMKFARFTKANLSGAVLKEMNLFQGTFEKANLTNTDCSSSNFYAVEFLDAIIKGAKFQFANLKMTKLAK